MPGPVRSAMRRSPTMGASVLATAMSFRDRPFVSEDNSSRCILWPPNAHFSFCNDQFPCLYVRIVKPECSIRTYLALVHSADESGTSCYHYLPLTASLPSLHHLFFIHGRIPFLRAAQAEWKSRACASVIPMSYLLESDQSFTKAQFNASGLFAFLSLFRASLRPATPTSLSRSWTCAAFAKLLSGKSYSLTCFATQAFRAHSTHSP
jgi:hypothetical protein